MGDLLDALWAVFETALWECVVVVVGGAVTWVLAQAKTYLGLKVEAQHREALERAIVSGIRAGVDGDPSTHPIDPIIDYVRQSVPDAVKALKPSEQVLRQKVQGALNKEQGWLG